MLPGNQPEPASSTVHDFDRTIDDGEPQAVPTGHVALILSELLKLFKNRKGSLHTDAAVFFRQHKIQIPLVNRLLGDRYVYITSSCKPNGMIDQI